MTLNKRSAPITGLAWARSRHEPRSRLSCVILGDSAKDYNQIAVRCDIVSFGQRHVVHHTFFPKHDPDFLSDSGYFFNVIFRDMGFRSPGLHRFVQAFHVTKSKCWIIKMARVKRESVDLI